MKLYLATTNLNKIKEIKQFLNNYFKVCEEDSSYQKADKKQPVLIKSLKDFPDYLSPEETGLSFQENAHIKSSSLFQYLKSKGLLSDSIGILAEDSGLELEALQGAPGIYSARYAGEPADDKKNNSFLLKKMKNKVSRKASYSCVLSFLFFQNNKIQQKIFSGICKGSLAKQERGERGFGYDPLFIPQFQDKTFGELPSEFKQKHSHRTKALEQWKDFVINNKILEMR